MPAISMHEPDLEQVFGDLFEWCRQRDFAGYDPFDALNSHLFRSTPLRHSQTARLVWTQLLKRSPLNVRALVRVPQQRNAKGIALFALAALSNFRRLKTVAAETEARKLIDDLWQMRLANYSGAAWGYNFDWQSRNFFAPQGTPMIVPTAFATRALIEAHEAFADNNYLQRARSSCDFIINDLKRSDESEDEVCFSYSPLDSTQIYNAGLLAGETLASVGSLTGENELCGLAIRATRYAVRRQHEDGAWSYGNRSGQQWVDSFHTAYVLLSLSRIAKFCNPMDLSFHQALQRGYKFWRERFFLADGWPKYYHDHLYPADAHSAATAIVTLLELQELDPGTLPLAEKIAAWTIRNLRDRRGFFYYQRRRFFTIQTAYMRWTQAWMLYALARLLEEKSREATSV
jgi:hypothetical protein